MNPTNEASLHSAENDGNQFLTFITDGEEYGVDILRVQEIRGWDRVTSIPNTPDYVKGVINLRGAIVPIIDLRARFGLPATEYGKSTVVIVLRTETDTHSRIVGIVVDAVSEVYTVKSEEVSAPPDLGSHAVAFLTGIATVNDEMIMLLDIDLLLSSGELEELDKISS